MLGLTMVPEEGESTVYGMTAFLIESSTPDNPVVQVRSNLGGERVYYNVEVNKVDPENATQLEMFALLSYTDKMGVTDGGAFGSFQKLQTYSMNAHQNGYCEDPSGVDTFLNTTFNWSELIESVMQDYLDAQLQSQYKDCENLKDFFEERESEDEDYVQFIQDKMAEILEKIEKGETEESYRIGAGSFTEDEWDDFLENFDSIQEVLKELMEERIEKKEEEALEQEQVEKQLEEELLLAESTSCTYPTADLEDSAIRYITWYTEEGIFCRKLGQTEGYEWKITFDSSEQYEKVVGFISHFPDDYNMRFAAHENFWQDFLKDEIDLDSFMEFLQRTNNGVPDYSQKVGDSMYVDETKVQWAQYLNPLGSRFYTADEMTQMQEEIMEANNAGKEKVEANEGDVVTPNQSGGIDMDKVIEVEVVSLPDVGISFYYNLSTGIMECLDDRNTQPGRQVKWSKTLSEAEYEKCQALFYRTKGERTWEYVYEEYLVDEVFWDKFLNNEIELAELK